MIFLDTGYYIALFDGADALHDRAARWSLKINEPLVVTEYVLLETINHFSKQNLRPRAIRIIDIVMRDEGHLVVSVDERLLQKGMELFRQSSDKSWSLTDCVSFEVMQSRNITRALAYDHHFEQAGFEALLRREPD